MTFNSNIIPGTFSIDKVLHVAGIFTITILFGSWFGLLVGCLVGLVVGAARELYKAFTPGMSMEWMSIACDALGILIAILSAPHLLH